MAHSRIRVLSVVTNLKMGGDESRLLTFSRAVDRSRFDHSVLVLTPPDDDEIARFGLLKPHFDRYQISVEHLGEMPRSRRRQKQHGLSLLWGDMQSAFRVVRHLTRYIREHQIDVVDARPNYATLFGLLAGRLARVSAVVTTSYGPDEMWTGPLRYLIGQTMFGLVDAIISDSTFAIQQLERWILRKNRRTIVIPNGIFPPLSEKSRAEVRQFFGFPDDPQLRIVGQVSRLVPYKGVHNLLLSAREVLAQEPATAFLLCGYADPPEYLQELRELAMQLGIADRVRIGGYPGLIGDVWGAIDVHAHASLRDSSPIALHESMAAGLPAVVTRVGGIPDLVEEGETALVVSPGDPQALAKALLSVLRDPLLARRLGQNAQKRFNDSFRAPTMARRLENLFSTLVSTRSSASDDAPKRTAGVRNSLS